MRSRNSSINFNFEAAYAGDPDAQYEAAMYLILKGQVNEAERWLRFAARKDHPYAKRILIDGIRIGFFLATKDRLYALASNLLEQIITPTPELEDVEALDQLLIKHLKDDFNFQINI